MNLLTPSEALFRLKELIETGTYGYNYTFVPTEKNRLLSELYYFDDKKKKEILLQLSEKDFDREGYGDSEEHKDDYLYVFIKRGIKLLPRYSTELKTEQVDIYIKFYFAGDVNNIVFVLSFHKADDY